MLSLPFPRSIKSRLAQYFRLPETAISSLRKQDLFMGDKLLSLAVAERLDGLGLLPDSATLTVQRYTTNEALADFARAVVLAVPSRIVSGDGEGSRPEGAKRMSLSADLPLFTVRDDHNVGDYLEGLLYVCRGRSLTVPGCSAAQSAPNRFDEVIAELISWVDTTRAIPPVKPPGGKKRGAPASLVRQATKERKAKKEAPPPTKKQTAAASSKAPAAPRKRRTSTLPVA